ncbi:hypothetical protein [Longimicrobium sp.]|uniref:hypothetical protein n=1 Tax=Longimicrobium sp. TaxID=2029185 RepID=UPI002E333D2F|nr:hypothetical protein [Longimicrobium sp.]HEX6038965.1 hypothetical protein [Longimicrobium sp.]
MKKPRIQAFALAALLLASACGDIPSGSSAAREPVAVARHQKLLGTVTCRVDAVAGTTKCGDATAAGGANQTRVLLSSHFTVLTNQQFTSGGTAYFFNEIRNDLGQAIGTNTGVDVDTIYAFISNIQVTGGSGTVTVSNADGTATFTAANQPFWKWRQTIDPGYTTGTSIWTFSVPGTVTSWTYTVGLSAPIAHPNGWVDISGNSQIQHGQYQLLTATVHDWTGTVNTSGSVSWTGTNVSGQIYVSQWDDRTGHVLGVRTGTGEVTASFGTATPKTVGVNVY